MSGKGSKMRAMKVSRSEFEDNWDLAFKKKVNACVDDFMHKLADSPIEDDEPTHTDKGPDQDIIN